MAQVLYKYAGIHDLLPQAGRILSELGTRWAFSDEQVKKVKPQLADLKALQKRYYQIVEIEPALAKSRVKIVGMAKRRDKYKNGKKDSDRLRSVVAKKDDALQKIERQYPKDKKELERDKTYKSLKKERDKLMKDWEKARKEENEFDRLSKEVTALRENYDKAHNTLIRNYGVKLVKTKSALVLMFGNKPGYTIPF